MAKSKLTHTRSTVDKVAVKGILSDDKTTVAYTDENGDESEVTIDELLDGFAGQEIEFGVQIKKSEELV